MIHIDFDPQALTGNQKAEWDSIVAEYETLTKEIIQKWETNGKLTSKDFKDSSKYWGKLKDFLLKNIFNNKCAYCETNIKLARQFGDADHFRPKARVNYKTNPEPECKKYKLAYAIDYRVTPSGEIKHPGYFWLAFNWKNLLPACIKCNSGQGKKNQFPILSQEYLLNVKLSPAQVSQLKGNAIQSETDPDIYYLDVEDLNEHEKPALLHPFFGVDPLDHIEFTPDGRIRSRKVNGKESKIGKESISAYDLWDEQLRQAREDAQRDAENKYLSAYLHFRCQGFSPEQARQKAKSQDETIKSVLSGKAPYSAAQKDFLNTWVFSQFG